MGAQLFDDAFLPHLCLGSLQILKEFVDANPVDDESLPKFHTAVAAKEECDGQLQEEESERSEVTDEEGWVKLDTAIAAEEERESLPAKKTLSGLKHRMKKALQSVPQPWRRKARGNSTKKFSR